MNTGLLCALRFFAVKLAFSYRKGAKSAEKAQASESSIMNRRNFLAVSLISTTTMSSRHVLSDETATDNSRKHPLSDAERAELKQTFDKGIRGTTQTLEKQPDDSEALSKRGDWYFFRGDFAESLRDYQKMCELKPETEAAHWRLGLAQFYAGQFETSAKFFDRFFKTDDVDREGGLWKYLAQAKASGPEAARAGLLKYTKFDREPMPTVYQLFEGTITLDELLKTVDKAKLTEEGRTMRLFYIELYIGLWLDAHKQPREALPHLRAATANSWSRTAGYGPNWMWHVARVHFEKLAKSP